MGSINLSSKNSDMKYTEEGQVIQEKRKSKRKGSERGFTAAHMLPCQDEVCGVAIGRNRRRRRSSMVGPLYWKVVMAYGKGMACIIVHCPGLTMLHKYK